MKKCYNRDELIDYLTARELGNHAIFETPNCVQQRFTRAWKAKRIIIDEWLTELEKEQQVEACINKIIS